MSSLSRVCAGSMIESDEFDDDGGRVDGTSTTLVVCAGHDVSAIDWSSVCGMDVNGVGGDGVCLT